MLIELCLAFLLACGGSASAGLGPPAPGTSPALQVPPSGARECDAPKPEWIWCDDFEVDRLRRYFEYDDRNASFVRAAAVGRDGSSGMRARWQFGQVNAGALHLAFGRVPGAYFKTVDAGTRDYREIHWRVWVRHSEGWSGGGAGKLTRAIVFGSSEWATAIKALVWSGRHADKPGSQDDQHHLMIEPTSGTSAEGTLLTTTYSDRAHVRWLGSRMGAASLFAPDQVSAWHCVEARVRLNSRGRSDTWMASS